MAAIEDRKYQVDAVDAVSAKWRAGDKRVLLVLSTGGGKTTIAAMAILRAVANGKKCLVVAHRRNLVKQIAERLMEFGIRYSVVMAQLPLAEPWVRRDPNPSVWIASKDTLISWLGSDGWDESIQPDLMFGDEAHRIDEISYSKMLARCPAKYWMGMTATPIRPDGTGLGKKNWDSIVVGATVRQLIDGGYLVPARVYAPPGVIQRRIEGKKVRVSGDPVEEWMQHAEGKRTIAFLPDVATARGVMDRFVAAGVPSAILSAQSTNEERAETMAKVRDGSIRWLGNVELFTEGMDCPELECVQILKKLESLRGCIQVIGRVLRACKSIDKKYAIVLDHSGCTGLHRYPEIEPEWKLDESGVEFQKRHSARIEKELGKPIDCRKCGAVFAGVPKCPYCGEPIPPSKKRKELVYDAEGLAPAGSTKAVVASKEQKAWDRILWLARYRGFTCGAAFMMFKDKVKMTPQEARVRPLFGFHQKDMPVSLAEQSSRSFSPR